ncbi:MAG: MoxR family ATPase [Alphaproteobacteria bacterium]|nr:MoxR family ATPase [Alphaproteobacteria bacterium]
MSEVKEKIIALQKYLDSQIIGQRDLVKKLIITLLADGHALLEGAPGLAKTKAIKTLAQCVKATYNRIQFTPDLLPSDITGSDIYIAERCEFEFRKGPVFANMVLADEINRAPAKVQSALLEAMAERQVSVGGKQYRLPDLFMVLATQNPIEQEGTYNLPEAQLDRFLMYIKIGHPNAETERKILKLVRMEQLGVKEQEPAWQEFMQTVGKINVEDVIKARKDVLSMHMSEQLEEYIVQLIMATRNPEKYDSSLKDSILFGASPRATIALDKCAKINAWLEGRDFVTPEDVHAVIYEVLRHRIILSFEAQAEGLTTDDVITSIIKLVPLP